MRLCVICLHLYVHDLHSRVCCSNFLFFIYVSKIITFPKSICARNWHVCDQHELFILKRVGISEKDKFEKILNHGSLTSRVSKTV